MNERPILFSGEMVRAILDGRKEMTRRVVKFPEHVPQIVIPDIASVNPDGRGDWVAWSPKPVTDEQSIKRYPNGGGFKCPYGRPGDLLWVRETFMENHGGSVSYKASQSQGLLALNLELGNKWTPSIFMPRWASRLTLRVTAVRVERVQDIGIYDIAKEGLEISGLIAGFEIESDYAPGDNPDEYYCAARDEFAALWDSINAKRGYSWDSNPFVWVVSFERVD